jgi:hypothetical protein
MDENILELYYILEGCEKGIDFSIYENNIIKIFNSNRTNLSFLGDIPHNRKGITKIYQIDDDIAYTNAIIELRNLCMQLVKLAPVFNVDECVDLTSIEQVLAVSAQIKAALQGSAKQSFTNLNSNNAIMILSNKTEFHLELPNSYLNPYSEGQDVIVWLNKSNEEKEAELQEMVLENKSTNIFVSRRIEIERFDSVYYNLYRQMQSRKKKRGIRAFWLRQFLPVFITLLITGGLLFVFNILFLKGFYQLMYEVAVKGWEYLIFPLAIFAVIIVIIYLISLLMTRISYHHDRNYYLIFTVFISLLCALISYFLLTMLPLWLIIIMWCFPILSCIIRKAAGADNSGLPGHIFGIFMALSITQICSGLGLGWKIVSWVILLVLTGFRELRYWLGYQY